MKMKAGKKYNPEERTRKNEEFKSKGLIVESPTHLGVLVPPKKQKHRRVTHRRQVKKKMQNFTSQGIDCGVHEILGRRPYMEDRHSVYYDISAGRSAPTVYSFFGVFDGHGGDLTSTFLKNNLAPCVAKQESFPDEMAKALRDGLLACDRDLFELHPKCYDDGSTVVFAVLSSSEKPEKLWVANSGDSRAVMGKLTPEGIIAVPLSDDHKPSRPDEKKRVEQAGGLVEQARIFGTALGPMRIYTSNRQGGLAVSRGAGDGFLKAQKLVIADPEICYHEITEDCLFMILATDGLWDEFSNIQAVQFVYDNLKNGVDAQSSSKQIVEAAFMQGSQDNITALVVYFHPHPPASQSENAQAEQTNSPSASS